MHTDDFDDTFDRHTRAKREAHHHRRLQDHDEVHWAEIQRPRRRVKRQVPSEQTETYFNDPLWPQQWYVVSILLWPKAVRIQTEASRPQHDTRSSLHQVKVDLRIVGAWKAGYTGKGVTVSILDDGVQRNHSDLAANYVCLMTEF